MLATNYDKVLPQDFHSLGRGSYNRTAGKAQDFVQDAVRADAKVVQEFAEGLLACLLEFIDGGRDFLVAREQVRGQPPCRPRARTACSLAWARCTPFKILRFAGNPIRGSTRARTGIPGKEI